MSCQMMTMMTAIPLALTVCAICQSSGLVIPCLTCGRQQCEDCFLQQSDEKRMCRGCEMEKELEMDRVEEPVEEESIEEEPVEESAEQPMPRPVMGYRPTEYIEPGTVLFQPIPRPLVDQWIYAERLLENYIAFVMSKEAPSKPVPGFQYLVGRFTHSTRMALVTDYMLCYEEDENGSYGWTRYMSTYYNMSPMPYDGNIFYPHPLPLSLFF